MLGGLLGQGFDDPKSAANMALAAGLLRGDFGGGLLGANQAFAQAKQGRTQEEMRQLQMQEARMKMEDAQRQRQFLQGIPDLSQGIPPELMPRAVQAGALSFGDYLNSMRKDESPLTVAPGASLVDRRTMKPVFTAPKEQTPPAAIQEYQFAVQQGYKGTFEQWDTARKRAGANNVSLSVNTEKNLLNDIAGGLGKGIVTARDNAQAALGTINTVNRLNEALDSGSVMAGPSSNFRQWGLQVGQVMGIGGKDANERLVNTRQAIQSLAQLELDAAQAMKGQGQITEAERDIIRRAAAGDIERMTVPELRTLANTLDKTARSKIRGYNTQVQPLVKNPNAAPIAPFLNVDEPPERKPAPGAGAVRRYNHATGRIE